LPTHPAADLSPPIGLDVLPDLLRRRGVEVARKRLQEAAAGGVIPARPEGGRYLVAEADLPVVEAFFRANPRGTARGGGLTGANDGGRSRGENHAPKVGGARQETSGRAPKRLSTAHAARGRPSGEPSG